MKFKTLASALMGVSLLCSATSVFAQTELKVWCWDEYFNIAAIKEAADRYKDINPDVKITVENLEVPDLVRKTRELLDSKKYSELPDILLIEDYRAQSFLKDYPNFLKPLTKIDTTQFVDFKVAASSLYGHSYGVPFDSGVVANFIRFDLFQKAGYNMEDFQDLTWNKFIEMGIKVKEATGAYLISCDPDDLSLVRALMQSVGTWYVKGDGTQVNIAKNKGLEEGLKIIKTLQDHDLIHYYSGWNQLLESFNNGHVAAVVQGCWVTPSIEAAKDQAGKWVVTEMPRLDSVEGATPYSNLGGSQWFISSYSRNGDLAEDFLNETLVKDKDLLNSLVTKISLVNSLKDTTGMANYDAESAFFSNQKIYRNFADWNAQIPVVTYGPYTYEIEDVAIEALQRVLSGEDPEIVLEEVQSQAEALVK